MAVTSAVGVVALRGVSIFLRLTTGKAAKPRLVGRFSAGFTGNLGTMGSAHKVPFLVLLPLEIRGLVSLSALGCVEPGSPLWVGITSAATSLSGFSTFSMTASDFESALTFSSSGSTFGVLSILTTSETMSFLTTLSGGVSCLNGGSTLTILNLSSVLIGGGIAAGWGA